MIKPKKKAHKGSGYCSNKKVTPKTPITTPLAIPAIRVVKNKPSIACHRPLIPSVLKRVIKLKLKDLMEMLMPLSWWIGMVAGLGI